MILTALVFSLGILCVGYVFNNKDLGGKKNTEEKITDFDKLKDDITLQCLIEN